MVTIPRRESNRRGICLPLFTDTEGGSCFGIYHNYQLNITSLSRNFVYSVQTFREFCQGHFTILLQIQHENNFLATSEHRQAKVRRLLSICLLHLANKFRLPKMSRSETPSWLRSQNSE